MLVIYWFFESGLAFVLLPRARTWILLPPLLFIIGNPPPWPSLYMKSYGLHRKTHDTHGKSYQINRRSNGFIKKFYKIIWNLSLETNRHWLLALEKCVVLVRTYTRNLYAWNFDFCVESYSPRHPFFTFLSTVYICVFLFISLSIYSLSLSLSTLFLSLALFLLAYHHTRTSSSPLLFIVWNPPPWATLHALFGKRNYFVLKLFTCWCYTSRAL